MDGITNLNSGIFAVFADPAATGLGSALGAPAMPTDGQFQDILGLVSDTAIADEQSGVLKDSIQEGAKDLTPDNARAQLELAAMQPNLNAAQIPALPTQTSNVGQPKQASVETKSLTGTAAQMMALPQMQDLSALGQLNLDAKKDAIQIQLDPNAVAEWAAALASGDMKGVTLEKDQAVPALKADMTVAKNLQGLRAEEASLDSTLANLIQPVTAKDANAPAENQKKASLPGMANEASTVTAKNAESKPVASDFVASPFLKVSPKNTEVTEKKPTSMSGQDFILQQVTSVKAEPTSKATPSTLVGAATLGENTDRRISPESLNFVAQKIETLKAQGGGTLRVDLNPGELGSVQIRVSMAKSGLQVQVLAERPETVQALQASQGDLTQKLNAISPVKLELGMAKEVPQVAADKLSKVTQSANSTQEVLSLRGGEKSAAPSASLQPARPQPEIRDMGRGMEVHAEMASDSANKSNFSSGNGSQTGKDADSGRSSRNDQGWNRDERREKAQNRWEEFLDGHRKSA